MKLTNKNKIGVLLIVISFVTGFLTMWHYDGIVVANKVFGGVTAVVIWTFTIAWLME